MKEYENGETVGESGDPAFALRGYGGQAESGLRVKILTIVRRYRRRYCYPSDTVKNFMKCYENRDAVDESGDESGLRVKILTIVHRSRRRSRQPKRQ